MGSVKLQDIERFMATQEACVDSRIWFRKMRDERDGPRTPEAYWHALLRLDWRWWVLAKLGVGQNRIRAYLTNVAWNLSRRTHAHDFSGFPVSELLGLLDDPKVRNEGDQAAYLAYLSRDAEKRLGLNSFHYHLIAACENLAKSVLKRDEEYGYLKHAAVNLNYAIDSAEPSGVAFDPESVRDPFGWPELQDTITSSDFFNLTPA